MRQCCADSQFARTPFWPFCWFQLCFFFWGFDRFGQSQRNLRHVGAVLVAILFGLCFIAFAKHEAPSLGSFITGLDQRYIVQCESHLVQIHRALQAYHNEYHSFPPAYFADEQGSPIHSWRVMLLPFLGHEELYMQYDFSKPWYSPVNQKLANQRPDVYSCLDSHNPNLAPDETCCLATTGAHTMWPGAKSRTLPQVSDDPRTTVSLIHAHPKKVQWICPEDVSVEEAVEILTRHNNAPAQAASKTVYAISADSGTARFLFGVSPDLCRSLFTVDGAENVFELDVWDPQYRSMSPPSKWTDKWSALGCRDFSSCIAWIGLIVLGLLPTLWAWRRDANSVQSATQEARTQ